MLSFDIRSIGFQVNNVSDMSKEICGIYKSLDKEDAEHIITLLVSNIKKQILKGNEVKISKFGTFKCRLKSKSVKKNIFGEIQIKPEMLEPYFESNKTLRRYINGSKR